MAAILDDSRRLQREDLDRRLLSWIESVPELGERLATLPARVAEPARRLLGGEPLAVDRFDAAVSEKTAEAARALAAGSVPSSDVLEGDGAPMLCVPDHVFENWGLTVRNTPAATYLPRTVQGVCNLVRWASDHGKRVRVAGYRHTWESLYAADGEILISTLPLAEVEELPAVYPPIDPHNELQGVRIVGYKRVDGKRRALCRIGAATTNEQFRQWCLDLFGGFWQWTLPLNVIMVEITFGGSNAPICHGAGLRNQTLSDLVEEIELVNALGRVQTIRDPAQLRAASGCFGLLGVVTAVTLRLDPMTFASLRPEKRRVALAVPPPAGYEVPAEVDMSGVGPAELAAARADFVKRVSTHYYSEWFWFPYQPDCWINSWRNDGARFAASTYPPPDQVFLQWLETWIAELIRNWPPFQALPGREQAEMFGALAMSQLPEVQPGEPSITAPLIDALHFQRGIQNLRVLNFEMEIPIPPRADRPDLPDWSLCQRAWWDAIELVYEREDGPMRTTLEMRIMGDSDVILAPQRGNTFGTCAIEVLTTAHTPEDEWISFLQQLTDRWTSYRGPDGELLNVRPHWAKQWRKVKFRGNPAPLYLRYGAYKDRWPEFRAALASVCAAGGYEMADIRRMFSNPLVREVFDDALL